MTRAIGQVALIGALFVACSSSDEGLFGADDASAGTSGTSGVGGSAGIASGGGAGSVATGGSAGAGSAGESGSAGALVDAAAGASGSAGSAGAGGSGGSGGRGGPTPGTIFCGAAPCNTDFNVCCTCPNCPIPYPTTCFPKLTGCTGTGKLMTCDDAADCNGGVCCAHFQLPKYEFTGATCEANCPSEGNAQLCTVNDECPAEHQCKPLASIPGFRACQPK